MKLKRIIAMAGISIAVLSTTMTAFADSGPHFSRSDYGTYRWPSIAKPNSSKWDVTDQYHYENIRHSDGWEWDRCYEYTSRSTDGPWKGNQGPWICSKKSVSTVNGVTTVIIEDLQLVVPDNNPQGSVVTRYHFQFPGASELYTKTNGWNYERYNYWGSPIYSDNWYKQKDPSKLTCGGEGRCNEDRAGCYNSYGKRLSLKIVYNNLSEIPKWSVITSTGLDAGDRFSAGTGYGHTSGWSVDYVLFDNIPISGVTGTQGFHQHNSKGIDYVDLNKTQHKVYSYCNETHGTDKTQNRKEVRSEDHYDINHDGLCDACGHTIDYKIYFNLYGGTASATLPSEYNVKSASMTLPSASKSGYRFLGWVGGGDPADVSNKAISEVPSNVTIETGTHGDLYYRAVFVKTGNASKGEVSPNTNSDPKEIWI